MADAGELWRRATAVLPGGVNSPVRSFRGVGGEPFFARAGEGAYLIAEDGRRFLDFVMGYGPLILGHAHPAVVEAVREQAARGIGFGVPTEAEVALAESLTAAIGPLEVVRLVNSGTEATMSALRVARAATGRELVVKFAGSYHGHHDSLLIKAGSGAATVGVPDSAGVPAAMAALTLTVPYNDVEALTALFRERGPEIAAVILEPVAGNMGTVPPSPEFLEAVRTLSREAGALFIADEVMTGFRVAWGGATELFGLDPDLICLAKVVGAGLPLGVYGGRRMYMDLVAPAGPVYQAGTFAGNPLAVAAGRAQLTAIGGAAFYPPLEQKTRYLAEGLVDRGRRRGLAVAANVAGGMFTLFFRPTPPRNFEEVQASDRERYARFFHGMLEQGIFFPPSQFETAFLSSAHSLDDLERTIRAADAVFARI
ncbi:MAG: glutamate-1-semialdehyde 2,1-aminomutase [Firmicutes bacterium]|nr:glutamate-1-semialdehyde 2,1-aminomutase [Bacillota bacterium]